jgi:hypothetical protein
MKYRNSEGYADPTAGAALARIEYEERLKRRQKKHCNASGKSKKSPPNQKNAMRKAARFITIRHCWYEHAQANNSMEVPK